MLKSANNHQGKEENPCLSGLLMILGDLHGLKANGELDLC